MAHSTCALDQRNAVPPGFLAGFVRNPPAAACHGPPEVSVTAVLGEEHLSVGPFRGVWYVCPARTYVVRTATR